MLFHPIPSTPADGAAFAACALTVAPTRRALTRQYKQTKPAAGVFTLTNQANGRVVVGGSLQLKGAMNRMRFELKMRLHRSQALQKDWTAHGAEQFSFSVVDPVKEPDDPHFHYQVELGSLPSLWREAVPCDGVRGDHGPQP